MKRIIYCTCFCLFLFSLINLVDAQENYPKINASDILKQIENGQDVCIERKIIEGNLNLSEAKLDINKDGLKVVKGTIEIDECIGKYIDFSNVLFKKEVIVTNSDLRKVNFSKSNFSKKFRIFRSNLSQSNFSDSVFEDEVIFMEANFFEVELDEINFKSGAFFENTEFVWVSFTNIVFDNRTSFNDVVFKGYNGLIGCIFNENVKFNHVNIGNSGIFKNTTFNGNVSFNNLNAARKIEFSEIKFAKNMRFESDLPQTDIKFNDVSFSGETDFSESQFKDIFFYSTDFNSDVIFDEMDYERMYVKWNGIKDNLVFNGPVYLKLRQNFLSYEEYTDSDDVYYQYRVETRNIDKDKNVIYKFLEFLALDVTCGYGVKPLKTLEIGSLAVIFFGLVYSTPSPLDYIKNFALHALNFKSYRHMVTKYKSIKKKAKREFIKEALKPFVYSLGVFTQTNIKNEKLESTHQYWIMTEKMLGWFTLTLFTIVLTNVMIRF